MLKKQFIALLIPTLCFVSMFFLGCTNPTQDTLSRIQERKLLKVGMMVSSYPWIYKDKQGQLTGFEIALIQKLSNALLGSPNAYQLIEIATPDRLRDLKTRRIDLFIGTFSATADRKHYFDYSQPYVSSSFKLLVIDNSGINDVDDLSGKSVGMLIGGVAESILKKHTPPGTKLVAVQKLRDARIGFENNRFDVFGSQEGVLMDYVINHCGVKILPKL